MRAARFLFTAELFVKSDGNVNFEVHIFTFGIENHSKCDFLLDKEQPTGV